MAFTRDSSAPKKKKQPPKPKPKPVKGLGGSLGLPAHIQKNVPKIKQPKKRTGADFRRLRGTFTPRQQRAEAQKRSARYLPRQSQPEGHYSPHFLTPKFSQAGPGSSYITSDLKTIGRIGRQARRIEQIQSDVARSLAPGYAIGKATASQFSHLDAETAAWDKLQAKLGGIGNRQFGPTSAARYMPDRYLGTPQHMRPTPGFVPGVVKITSKTPPPGDVTVTQQVRTKIPHSKQQYTLGITDISLPRKLSGLAGLAENAAWDAMTIPFGIPQFGYTVATHPLRAGEQMVEGFKGLADPHRWYTNPITNTLTAVSALAPAAGLASRGAALGKGLATGTLREQAFGKSAVAAGASAGPVRAAAKIIRYGPNPGTKLVADFERPLTIDNPELVMKRARLIELEGQRKALRTKRTVDNAAAVNAHQIAVAELRKQIRELEAQARAVRVSARSEAETTKKLASLRAQRDELKSVLANDKWTRHGHEALSSEERRAIGLTKTGKPNKGARHPTPEQAKIPPARRKKLEERLSGILDEIHSLSEGEQAPRGISAEVKAHAEKIASLKAQLDSLGPRPRKKVVDTEALDALGEQIDALRALKIPKTASVPDIIEAPYSQAALTRALQKVYWNTRMGQGSAEHAARVLEDAKQRAQVASDFGYEYGGRGILAGNKRVQEMTPEEQAALADALTRHPWLAKLLPNTAYGVALKNADLMKTPKGWKKVSAFIDSVNNLTRIGVLGGPQYLRNAPGNIGFNMLEQGPISGLTGPLFQTPRLVRQIKSLDPQVYQAMLKSMEAGKAYSFGTQGGLFHGLNQDYLGAMNFLTDRFQRLDALRHQAAMRGFRGAEDLQKLYTDPELAPLRNEMVAKGNQAMVDFARKHPGQDWVSRFIMFYPWLKGSALWMGRFAREHPTAAGLLAQAGAQGFEDQMRRTKGVGLPSYMWGAILGGSKQHPWAAGTQALNPFTTPSEVLGVTRNLGFMPAYLNQKAFRMSDYLQPWAQAALASITHINPFTGHTYPAGTGWDAILRDSFKTAIPGWKQYQDVQAAMKPPDPGHVYAKKTWGNVALGATWPRDINPKQVEQQAKSEIPPVTAGHGKAQLYVFEKSGDNARNKVFAEAKKYAPELLESGRLPRKIRDAYNVKTEYYARRVDGDVYRIKSDDPKRWHKETRRVEIAVQLAKQKKIPIGRAEEFDFAALYKMSEDDLQRWFLTANRGGKATMNEIERKLFSKTLDRYKARVDSHRKRKRGF